MKIKIEFDLDDIYADEFIPIFDGCLSGFDFEEIE